MTTARGRRMRAMPALLLTAGLAPSVVQGQARRPRHHDPALVFQGVNVVDVAEGRVRPDQTVVVVGEQMQAVGSRGKVRVPGGARVVDARGKYLIPGLWDMHVHVNGAAQPDSVFIAHGITGIREMSQNQDRPAEGWASRAAGAVGALEPGESPHGFATVLERRRQIARGERIGPRIVATTHDFFSPQCETSLAQMVGAQLPEGRCTEPSFVVTSPAQARRLVDSLQAIGADFVKLHVVSDRAVYFAIVGEARRLGLPAAGHLQAPGTGTPRPVTEIEASDSGLRSVEHILEMSCWVTDWRSVYSGGVAAPDSVVERQCGDVAAHFRRNGTWLTPTLVVHRGDLNFPHAQHAVSMLHRLGAPLLAGSDAMTMVWPGTPRLGSGVHEELALLVEAGLTPLEALRTATLNPAKYLKATDSLGTIAPKKLADLVLLDASPLADIHNTTKIAAVIANGRYFDRAALDALLATTREAP